MDHHIIHDGVNWTLSVTKHGCDIFKEGVYFTTISDEDDDKCEKEWVNRGAQFIKDLEEDY